MTALLDQLIQNSLSGAVLILGIFLFRKITGDLSKLYVRILWMVLLLVLLLPPVNSGSFHTVRNLIPETGQVFSEKQIIAAQEPEIEEATGTENPGGIVGSPGNNLSSGKEEGKASKIQGQNPETAKGLAIGAAEVLFILWILGAAGLTAVNLTGWRRLKKRAATAVQIDHDVWSTAQIDTPFVMPGFPARIYIPQELEAEKGQLKDILEHERRHIRNQDPWIKCIAVLALILHWFNPLVWFAFRAMNRDMEMYCDECVLCGKNAVQKKHYAQTLLDFACKRRGFSPVLYFGESSTKKRICHVLNTKRPHMLISLLLLLLISGCGVSFMSTGEESGKAVTDTQKESLFPEALPGEDTVNPEENSQDIADEEELWTDKVIVGTGHEGMEPGFDETEMSLMSETEHFALYSMHEGEAMAVQTPECLVYAEVPPISNYEIEPLIQEQDFDNDGKEELAIITYALHGTGISIRSLFMVDKAPDSSWNIYHYLEDDYTKELTSHFDTQYTEEGVRLIFDGEPTGAIEKVDQEELDNEYAYYAGSQIDFRFIEEKIILRAELAGYSNINYAGNYPGHELEAALNYMGEGKWEFASVNYADAGITELIENAIPLYLTGQTEEVNEHYTVSGTELPYFGETNQEVIILSILVPKEDLEGDEAEVYVTIRRDGSDSLDYLHVPMKKESSDIDRAWWRISGEITMEK